MPEYLSPGVYVEEVSSGTQPIQGVSTSTAGFLGQSERGPECPQLVTSWVEYQRWYGGYPPANTPSYLAYGVQGFFDNGGQRCFVARIVGNGAVLATGTIGGMAIMAVGRGTWGNRIFVRTMAASKPGNDPNAFRITILYFAAQPPANPPLNPFDPKNFSDKSFRTPDLVEDYDNITATAGATNYVANIVNGASHLIRVNWTGAVAPPPFDPANFPSFATAAGGTAGTDGAAVTAGDYVGDPNVLPSTLISGLIPAGNGLAAFESVDEIAIVVAPDQAQNVTFSQDLVPFLIGHCEKLRDRFAILSITPNSTDVTQIGVLQDSSFGAVYYPWISIYDPSKDTRVLVPSSGHVAGIYADTDVERGVHKAPANVVIQGALDLEFPIPKGVQDILNPINVNCHRDFRTSGRGIRVWGARTMSSDAEWRYVNVRRLFLYVEKSIDQGTQWVVFEPNDEPLWAAVRRNLTNFLVQIWRNGALMGQTEADAFFVKCDQTTMTADDIENGRLICYIGIAPVRPAEFVIFRISQKTIEAQQ